MITEFPGIEVPDGSRYCAVLAHDRHVDTLVGLVDTQLSKVGWGEVQINVLTDVQIDDEDRTSAVIGWVLP